MKFLGVRCFISTAEGKRPVCMETTVVTRCAYRKICWSIANKGWPVYFKILHICLCVGVHRCLHRTIVVLFFASSSGDPYTMTRGTSVKDTGPTSPGTDPLTPGRITTRGVEHHCLRQWYDSVRKSRVWSLCLPFLNWMRCHRVNKVVH